MATAKSWIKAARLRTLPLAVSGILMGAALSYFDGGFQTKVTILAVATALLIQIFSNFANDYGDFQKGTDNHHRVGTPADGSKRRNHSRTNEIWNGHIDRFKPSFWDLACDRRN